MVGVVRGYQRADTLKPYSPKPTEAFLGKMTVQSLLTGHLQGAEAYEVLRLWRWAGEARSLWTTVSPLGIWKLFHEGEVHVSGEAVIGMREYFPNKDL